MRTHPRPRPTKQGPVPASRAQVLLPGQGVCVVRFHNPTGWFYSSQVKVRYALSAGPTLSPDAARPKKPPPPPPPPKSPPVAEAAAALPTAAEAPSAAEEPAAATPTPKALSPEMGAALSRQLARRPSLDEVTSSSSRTPAPSPSLQPQLLAVALTRARASCRPQSPVPTPALSLYPALRRPPSPAPGRAGDECGHPAAARAAQRQAAGGRKAARRTRGARR